MSFIDRAPLTTHEMPFHVGAAGRFGHTVDPIPTIPGRLDFLAHGAIEIEDGQLDAVQVTDANGSPIFNLRAEYLPLTRGRIPLQIRDDGFGCLANFSETAPYRVHLTGRARGKITWAGRPLPPAGGTQLPPFPGTLQMWSNIYGLALWPGHQRLQLNRVGNLIPQLFLVVKDANGDPVQIHRTKKNGGGHGADLIYDSRILRKDNELYRWDEPHEPYNLKMWRTSPTPGVYRFEFDPGLPTVPSTYLAAEFHVPEMSTSHGYATWVINEMCVAQRIIGRP